MSQSSVSYLDAALKIGRSIVASAYWDPETRYCNWMGRSTREVSEVGGLVTPTSAALGPDFYGGSSGIALFLGYLAQHSQVESIRSTAIAAMGNAIRNFDRITTSYVQTLSFHGGLIGLAYVGHEVARMTESIELSQQADIVLGRILSDGPQGQVIDVIGGHAGAIPALLSLARSLARPELLEYAVTLGNDILSAAISQNDGLTTWSPERVSGPGISSKLLTGLAHGASGIGLALLELHQATARDDFLAAARGAFAYEDSLYDIEQRNWPDLRSMKPPGSESLEPDGPPSFALAWCHGAPGIALARARASHIDLAHAEAYKSTTRAALAITLEGMQRLAKQPRADATLCHGLTGLAEIVFTAGRWIDDSTFDSKATETVRLLIDRHSVTEDWPSGLTSKGPNPSLMLGSAGVGLHFLRRHDPNHVPSPLWIL